MKSAPAHSVSSTSVTAFNCLQTAYEERKIQFWGTAPRCCSQGQAGSTSPSVWVGSTTLLKNLLEIQSLSQAEPLGPAQDSVFRLLRPLDLFVCICVSSRGQGRWNSNLCPFLCGFQTQSGTPLSQLKLSISQGPKGESWLLEKAAQGRGWNDLVHQMGVFSPTPFLWVSWSEAIIIFFPILLFLLVTRGWANRGAGGLFPSDAFEA